MPVQLDVKSQKVIIRLLQQWCFLPSMREAQRHVGAQEYAARWQLLAAVSVIQSR